MVRWDGSLSTGVVAEREENSRLKGSVQARWNKLGNNERNRKEIRRIVVVVEMLWDGCGILCGSQ